MTSPQSCTGSEPAATRGAVIAALVAGLDDVGRLEVLEALTEAGLLHRSWSRTYSAQRLGDDGVIGISFSTHDELRFRRAVTDMPNAFEGYDLVQHDTHTYSASIHTEPQPYPDWRQDPDAGA